MLGSQHQHFRARPQEERQPQCGWASSPSNLDAGVIEHLSRVPFKNRNGKLTYLFRPTVKTAKELKLNLKEVEPLEHDPPAGSWFVAFDRFSRRGYLLFMHSITLYSILVRAPKSFERHLLHSIFTEQMFRVLKNQGMDRAFELLADPADEPPHFARTNSRSIISSMTNHRLALDFYDEASPFLDSDLVDPVVRLNRTPMSALGEGSDWGIPYQALSKWVAEKKQPRRTEPGT